MTLKPFTIYKLHNTENNTHQRLSHSCFPTETRTTGCCLVTRLLHVHFLRSMSDQSYEQTVLKQDSNDRCKNRAIYIELGFFRSQQNNNKFENLYKNRLNKPDKILTETLLKPCQQPQTQGQVMIRAELFSKLELQYRTFVC